MIKKIRYNRICSLCKNDYSVIFSRIGKTKYCSRICADKAQTGIKIGSHSHEHKIKIGIGNKGKKRPDLSEYNRKNVKKGEECWNWNPNRSEESEKHLIRHSKEYKLWRTAVFERDNYTCCHCNIRGGDLEADHIKQFALYPDLRLDISNGRTLCRTCHKKTFIFLGNQHKKILTLNSV